MANQIKPPTPLATEEFKEVNTENYKDRFELSQKEVSRLTAENRELILKSEKQSKKLEKKKVELETEKTNSVTFRQFIQELNNKVQLLERAAPPSVTPTIPLAHTPILDTVLSEVFVEKLVIEKSGLESQVCEQKREIEFLNSELISYMNKLAHFTESQNPAFAPNHELTQLRADLALKEQRLVECKSNYSSLEAECKLVKQLFQDALASLSADKEQLQQHLDVERGVNGKLGLEIEQHMKLIGAQRTSLLENAENFKLTAELDNANDQILKLKQSNLSNEDHLRRKINGLANENMELNNNINTFRFKIEEQNNQIIASKQSQRETDKTQTQLETKDKQISNLKMQIMDQQATEQTNQNQVEKQLKELNDEIEQLQRDNVDLENVIKSEQNTEKCFALDSDKRVLEDQIDLLHGHIETLTLSQQEGKQKIEDLEGSYENLTNQSKDLEIQLGESKSDFKRLQTEREETSQHSQQLIDELKTELEAARNERDRERDNSVISKQLITKLNSDIKNLEQNDSGQRIAELERQLAETEKAWTDTELKLGDMAAEIAHRDTRIHTLKQDIGIFQNRAQVTQNNQAKVSKDQTKLKHPDTSGATSSATVSDLTPQIVPVANKSGRAPLKFLLRPGIPVSAVKLKAFPNPIEYQGNQVICIVNKRYELGIFMVLFEIQTRLNMRNVTVKYVGIILDSPVGNCNGEFRTKRYFECEPNCGIFVPFEDVLVPVV